jgi:hypothetical protein
MKYIRKKGKTSIFIGLYAVETVTVLYCKVGIWMKPCKKKQHYNVHCFRSGPENELSKNIKIKILLPVEKADPFAVASTVPKMKLQSLKKVYD